MVLSVYFCIFDSDTVKNDCPNNPDFLENNEIFKDLIQTVGFTY